MAVPVGCVDSTMMRRKILSHIWDVWSSGCWQMKSRTVPSTMQYPDLVKALSTHYKPALIVIAERFRFQKLNQKESETVSAMVFQAHLQFSSLPWTKFYKGLSM